MRQKWHTAHRNLKTGDLVLIQDSNLVRGQWQLGIVSNTLPGSDGKVRRVEVQYKNPKQGEPVTKYQGRGYPLLPLLLLHVNNSFFCFKKSGFFYLWNTGQFNQSKHGKKKQRNKHKQFKAYLFSRFVHMFYKID